MERIKVIKGTPIYTYRSISSLDPIPNLIIKEMEYDSDNNITYVRLKKKTIRIELLCSIVIIFCIAFTIMNYNGISIKCNYNSLVNYYDNKLFLNWQNPNENSIDITFELVDSTDIIYTVTLSPGESITSIDIEEPKDKYFCNINSKYLFKEMSESVSLIVINRELKQGE